MTRVHVLTLSGAVAIAKAAGCDAKHYDGRLWIFRDTRLLGSTLVTQSLPPPSEPEVSRWSFDKIMSKEPIDEQ